MCSSVVGEHVLCWKFKQWWQRIDCMCRSVELTTKLIERLNKMLEPMEEMANVFVVTGPTTHDSRALSHCRLRIENCGLVHSWETSSAGWCDYRWWCKLQNMTFAKRNKIVCFFLSKFTIWLFFQVANFKYDFGLDDDWWWCWFCRGWRCGWCLPPMLMLMIWAEQR